MRAGDVRADEATYTLLGELAAAAGSHVAGAIAGDDPEDLHDLRVAVRRARSLAREMRSVLPKHEARNLRAELRWVQEVTGAVRDLDVQLDEWPLLVAACDAVHAAELDAVHAALVARREVERRALVETLRGERFARVLADWRSLTQTKPRRRSSAKAGRPIAVVASARIDRADRRVRRDGAAITDESPPVALHDLRKRGKALRYLLELYGPLFERDRVKPFVRALKQLQDVLGRFQDRQVQQELLRSLAADLPAATAPALDAVTSVLDADQRAARAEFAAQFAQFAATPSWRGSAAS